MGYKLSIGAALNEAFLFGLKRWPTVLRLGWAPVASFTLIVVAALLAVTSFSGSLENFANSAHAVDPREYLRVSPVLAVIIVGAAFLAGFVLLAGVAASIYRLVALGEERRGIFDLRMDGPALRVFFANVILGSIQIAIWMFAFIVATNIYETSIGDIVEAFWRLSNPLAWLYVMSAGLDGIGADLKNAVITINTAFWIAIVPVIFFGVKLAPFFAGSAATNRLLLFRSWRLTLGNFWRVAGAYFLFLIALFLVTQAFNIALETLSLTATVISTTGGVFAPLGVLLGIALIASMVVFQSFIYGTQLALQAIIYRQLEYGE